MHELEDSLYAWIAKLRSSHVPLHVAIIQERAGRAAEHVVQKYKDADEATKHKLHYEELKAFKASDGWYGKFAMYYGLC